MITQIVKIVLANNDEIDILELRKLVKVVDVLGRESQSTVNTLLFYIYDDGKVEKKIVIE